MANPVDTGTFEVWITDTSVANNVPGSGGSTGRFDTWITDTGYWQWYVRRNLTTTVSGSITPAGSLIKSVYTSMVGAIVPAGVLIKGVWIILSGAIAPIGSLVNIHNALLPPLFRGMYRRMFKRMR